MCKENREIKFCTCDGEKINNPDWKLTRSADFLRFPLSVIGRRIFSDEETENDENIIKYKILEKLKNNTLFDIDGYVPQEKDILEVFNSAIYRYLNDNWRIENYTSKDFWINENSISTTFFGKIE